MCVIRYAVSFAMHLRYINLEMKGYVALAFNGVPS